VISLYIFYLLSLGKSSSETRRLARGATPSLIPE
jgi:hypothetical protein